MMKPRGEPRGVSAMRSVLTQFHSTWPYVVADVVACTAMYCIVEFGNWESAFSVGGTVQDVAIFLIAILVGSKCDHQFDDFSCIREWEVSMVESFYTCCEIHSKQLIKQNDDDKSIHEAVEFMNKAIKVLDKIESSFLKNTIEGAEAAFDQLLSKSDPRSDSLNQYKHDTAELFRKAYSARRMPSIPQFEWYLSILVTVVVGVLPPIVSESPDWWIILGAFMSSAIIRTALVVFKEMGLEGFWSNHTKDEAAKLTTHFKHIQSRMRSHVKTISLRYIQQ